MDELLALLLGASKPLSFRYVIQPALAIVLGLRDARADERAGRPPYLLSVLRGRGHRRERLRNGARVIAVPFTIAVAIDLLVQALIGRRIHLWEGVVVGCLLIAVPYVVARALGNRAIAHRHGHRPVAP